MTAAHRIAVIPGDGIGPEVVAQALKALSAAAALHDFRVETREYDLGAERYLRTGDVLTPADVEELAGYDALLLGAVGDPRVPPAVLERGLVVRLRQEFDQYVNSRPVRLLPGVASPVAGLTPDRCDLVILRENSEGAYVGAGGTVFPGTEHEIVVQESISSWRATERLVRFGFELARRRRSHVTLCHKANVLTYAGELWLRVGRDLAAQYPDVGFDYVHADAMCLYLVTEPERFDVVVTDNLFGDVISDVGAAVQGGLGLAASANLNPERTGPSMFEPVHGSAPDIAGRGWANPAAAVLSTAACLLHLGEEDAAQAVERAVADVVAVLPAMRGPEMGATTDELGDEMAAAVRRQARRAVPLTQGAS
jgi:3-isopropylmalate dehydrogenase